MVLEPHLLLQQRLLQRLQLAQLLLLLLLHLQLRDLRSGTHEMHLLLNLHLLLRHLLRHRQCRLLDSCGGAGGLWWQHTDA